MQSRTPAVEIAVQDVDGLCIALRGGADRVELCSALGVGGLTPSIGTIESAVEAADSMGQSGFVHVLVRPRAGGFVYSPSEIDTTVRDIRAAQRAGAGGIVIGALTPDNLVDVVATREFIAAAEGINVTYHRAIDAGGDPLAALDTLIDLKVDRVLSSGGAAQSLDGVEVLAAMVERAAGRIQIMAGGGVTIGGIRALIEAGVDAVHLSARRVVDTAGPSGPGGGAAAYDVTDSALVAAAVEAARSTVEA
ncbi:copper homeostasis protein CutC [Leifsonia sp. A12D58]|uniref:copper homeostasis protein CutC n=1 Tax=Leifsonia sp. A12D58 TaxID=3397674 RepID=UPI0039DF626C